MPRCIWVLTLGLKMYSIHETYPSREISRGVAYGSARCHEIPNEMLTTKAVTHTRALMILVLVLYFVSTKKRKLCPDACLAWVQPGTLPDLSYIYCSYFNTHTTRPSQRSITTFPETGQTYSFPPPKLAKRALPLPPLLAAGGRRQDAI